MQLTPGKLQGIKRLSNKNGIFKMTAVDQRPPIKKPIAGLINPAINPYLNLFHFNVQLYLI